MTSNSCLHSQMRKHTCDLNYGVLSYTHIKRILFLGPQTFQPWTWPFLLQSLFSITIFSSRIPETLVLCIVLQNYVENDQS